MTYTVTFTDSHPFATNLMNFLKTFDFVTITKETGEMKHSALVKKETNTQHKKFEKMLMQGLNEVEAHKNGTKPFKTLDQVLSELYVG